MVTFNLAYCTAELPSKADMICHLPFRFSDLTEDLSPKHHNLDFLCYIFYHYMNVYIYINILHKILTRVSTLKIINLKTF